MKTQPKVLLVDDRTDHLEAAASALREAGHAVTTLSRVSAITPVYRAFRPDILVVAAHAPAFVAVAAVHQVQAISSDAVSCIYLVDAPDPELRRYCLERGHGVDAIAKPYDLLELVARVSAQLRQRRRMVRALGAGLEGRGGLRDPITGTFRRRVFLEMVGQERRRAERYGGVFSLAACNLKLAAAVDAEATRAQNRLLLDAVNRIQTVARESDTLARVGVGRLALLLPTVSDEALPALVLRLRASLQGLATPVAVGAVSFPEKLGTPKELLEAALVSAREPVGAEMVLQAPAEIEPELRYEVRPEVGMLWSR